MHSSHGRNRRKRSDSGENDEAPLLVSRADAALSETHSRAQLSRHADSYRTSTSSRSTYDMSRDASSSRNHHEADDWRPNPSSHSSRERYSYSSKDSYRRSSRDGYDVEDSREDGWGDQTASRRHYVPSSREWSHRYDHGHRTSSYPESSSWSASASFDNRTSSKDQWTMESNRRSVDEHTHSRPGVGDILSEKVSAWRRDGRKKGDRAWTRDSGWEPPHDGRKNWEEGRGRTGVEPEDSTNDRSWEPAPSWQHSSRDENE